MQIELYKAWSHLDKRWEFFVHIDEKSAWSQWVWFGIGSVIKNHDVTIYPYKPFYLSKKIRLLKKYKGTKHIASWYGKRIGETINKLRRVA